MNIPHLNSLPIHKKVNSFLSKPLLMKVHKTLKFTPRKQMGNTINTSIQQNGRKKKDLTLEGHSISREINKDYPNPGKKKTLYIF